MIRLTFLICTLLIFLGCSQKIQIQSSLAAVIVIKNSQIALADTGFVNYAQDAIELQIYKASTVVFELLVRDDVCLDGYCMKKSAFNRRFFGYKHYENFLDDILHSKQIYDGKGLKKISNGFEQKLLSEDYDLHYRVQAGQIYLKDKKNAVLLKLRPIK